MNASSCGFESRLGYMEITNTKDLILLTGAGFTKNFGGFLADEMWSHIFNNSLVQSSELLRSELQDNFDYESVYSNIIDNPKTGDEDKEKIKKAVFDAYKKLDDATKGWVFNDSSPHPVNIYGLGKLIQLFNSAGNDQGFFFTLNQDIFMERKFGYTSPGAPKFSEEFYHQLKDLTQSEFVTLKSEDIDNLVKKGIRDHAGFSYIKLHGSYGWKSADGSNQLVIGKNKVGTISNEPLLKCYFDIFESVIKQGAKKILVIGYGFQDQHINEVLLNGVKNHNLKIIILGQDPRSLKARIEHGHYYAKDILTGVIAYFPYNLKEIFPANQEETVHFRDIKDSLLK